MPENFEKIEPNKSSSSSVVPAESSSENRHLKNERLVTKPRKQVKRTYKQEKCNSETEEDECTEISRPKHKKLKRTKPVAIRIKDGSLADSEREESEVSIRKRFK